MSNTQTHKAKGPSHSPRRDSVRWFLIFCSLNVNSCKKYTPHSEKFPFNTRSHFYVSSLMHFHNSLGYVLETESLHPLKIHILKSKPPVWYLKVETLGSNEALCSWIRLMPFDERLQRTHLPLLPHEVTQKVPSMRKWSLTTPTLCRCHDASLQDCEK